MFTYYDDNESAWYYVVIKYYHAPSTRRHVRGLSQVKRMITGASVFAPLASVTVTEHRPPSEDE